MKKFQVITLEKISNVYEIEGEDTDTEETIREKFWDHIVWEVNETYNKTLEYEVVECSQIKEEEQTP